jgi:hypothetical protein
MDSRRWILLGLLNSIPRHRVPGVGRQVVRQMEIIVVCAKSTEASPSRHLYVAYPGKRRRKKELITMDLLLSFPPALHMLHSRKNLLPFAEASEGLELELAGPGGLEAKEGTPRLGRLRACAR